MEKVTFESDTKPWDCLPSKASFAARYRRMISSSFQPRVKKWSQIRNQHDKFESEIISRLSTAQGATLLSTRRKPSKQAPSSMEDFWTAVMEIAGTRIGLDIHVRAELGLEGNLANWHKDSDAARQHHIAIAERAKADQLDAVFSIWDKDISKWPGFEENEAELKRTLGTTKFVPLSGTPERIAEAILKEAQNLP
jgi:hypothetical protein